MNTNKRFNQYRKLINLLLANKKGSVAGLKVLDKAFQKLMPWEK